MAEKPPIDSRLDISDFKRLHLKRNDIPRAISTKMIHDAKNRDMAGFLGKIRPDQSVLERISNKTTTNIEDASAIFQSLPDIKIAMDLWTSCIISPKDFMNEALIWSTNNNTEYNSALFRKLLDEVRTYFIEDFDLLSHLKPAIEDALFKTGSYPLAIIPESSIDDIINNRQIVAQESLNSYFTSLEETSILGNPSSINQSNEIKVSTETIKNDMMDSIVRTVSIHPDCNVSDNPEILKFRLAKRQVNRRNLSKTLRKRYSLESCAISLEDKENEIIESDRFVKEQKEGKNENTGNKKTQRYDIKLQNHLVQELYQKRAYDGEEVVTVKVGRETERLPIGHPLVLKLPSGSVIPVHVPGNPSDILGAFILLDEYGNPLDRTKVTDLFTDSQQQDKSTISQAQTIIRQMNFYTDGCDNCDADNVRDSLNELAKVYTSLFEQDLLSRFANGIYGEDIQIARVDEAYRIMFSRALAAKRTQLLYLPSDLLTYFAFDYNRYGIGKSLLDDSKNLIAMRIAMLYADMYASLQNSIGRKKLNITLDELDPNPDKTVETIRTEYMRINSFNMPSIDSTPADIVNNLRDINLDTVIQGDNKVLPTTAVDVEDYHTDRVIPEDTIQDKVRGYLASSLGVPLTILDDSQQSQFAVANVNSHALFNKRVYNYQRIVSTRLLWDFVSKYVLNSGTLIKRLSLLIKEDINLLTEVQRNQKDTFGIIEDFLDALTIELPSPEVMKIEEQSKDYEAYKNMVGSMIDDMFPDDLLNSLLPESLRDNSNASREIFKSLLIRRYINDNQYLPSLSALLDKENSDDTVKTELQSNFLTFAEAVSDAFLELDRISKVSNSPELDQAMKDEEDAGGYGDNGDSSDDTGGDDFGGGDDGFDMNFDEESTEEGGTEEENENTENNNEFADLV